MGIFSQSRGAALHARDATLVVTDSLFTANSLPSGGSALFCTYGENGKTKHKLQSVGELRDVVQKELGIGLELSAEK